MPISWYVVPYGRFWDQYHVPGIMPCRYIEIDDYTAQIEDNGGQWAATEVLGIGLGLGIAIVKVRARQAILDALDNRFFRLPRNRLDDPLSGLPPQTIDHMRDLLLNAGYSLDEIHEAFGGGLENYTLRDYLHFWARRRLKPRWDRVADKIVLDGPVRGCRSIESVDDEVTE